MPKDISIKSILVVGSGPIVIGQAAEFDYAGTQACIALKEEGYRVILVNNNPATVMTDDLFADAVYFEPLTLDSLEKIIDRERPDGLLATLGGQAGLNMAFQLNEAGVLEKYGVKVLGTSIDSIKQGEDREAFRDLMNQLGEPVPDSSVVQSIESAVQFAVQVGLPVIVRPAYTLGGSGGGIAHSLESLTALVEGGLRESPISQCLIEKSIAGFKEIEYEMMRDEMGTCIAVCNMENIDPVGIHTGDSIVVAPSQTLTDRDYHMLRSSALKIISALGIVGGCNIQFALDPKSKQYYLIEVNPRVSRSSALASKATGYPIARMAAKLAIGYQLSELKNPVTGNTYASYEPALDYLVVKFPKWPFEKFPEVNRTLGTQMKATGEVMGIDRNFERALQKAVRSLNIKLTGLKLDTLKDKTVSELESSLSMQTDERFFIILEMMRKGVSINELHQKTQIDLFFLTYFEKLIKAESDITELSSETVSKTEMQHIKELGFSDSYLAAEWAVSEQEIRVLRKQLGVVPSFKMVDTCAAEFKSESNYYYSSYRGENEAITTNKRKVLVIGSGPISIGQGIEFDYCSVHGVFALKDQNVETIMINNNPETVSTDFAIADRLYFEPLCVEEILNVIEQEGLSEAIVQLGGQTALNLAEELERNGITLLGTSSKTIDLFEDRDLFYQLLDRLNIPRVKGYTAANDEELLNAAKMAGYPILVRPSYVIGGQGMRIINEETALKAMLGEGSITYPVLIDQYLQAMEAELDLVADGKNTLVPAIIEHIEKTGVHSGDSICLIPARSFSDEIKQKMLDYAEKIVKEINYKGLMNIQFIIDGEEVLVLEVNPRSSRSMPIVSKVTGVPIVQIATKILLGKYFLSNDYSYPLTPLPLPYSCIKHPVFSNYALMGLDPKTGPVMKSTGEGISVAATVEEALRKSFHSLIGNKTGRTVVFTDKAMPNDLVRLAEETGVIFAPYKEGILSDKNVIGLYSTEMTDIDREARGNAAQRRLITFSEKETLKAFLSSLRTTSWEVKPMGEWLKELREDVVVR
ncbi:carbamoyl phosphate synthase large subunit [Mesobacillus harenae]|uniref:carbamoyl phosphate synthase large subunit n=1 Tax=Mesobacillus harenae TaxID=2213203 RepID=UPI0015810071|nr:carbamoyl phosphate synthase large subunit [Mesobacillus harenae]